MVNEPATRPVPGSRIMAVRLGALGDTLCFLPVLAALRRFVGEEGRLTAMVRSGLEDVVVGERLASDAVVADRWPYSEVLATGRWPSEPQSWDWVLGWTASENLAAFAGRASQCRQFSALPPEGRHAVSQSTDPLDRAGNPTRSACLPRLPRARAGRVGAREALRGG